MRARIGRRVRSEGESEDGEVVSENSNLHDSSRNRQRQRVLSLGQQAWNLP